MKNNVRPIRRVGSRQGQPRATRIRQADLPVIADALGVDISSLVGVASKVQRQDDERERFNQMVYSGSTASRGARGI